jgi:uncharacterized protein
VTVVRHHELPTPPLDSVTTMLVVNVADLLRRLGTRRDVHREAVPDGLALTSSRVPAGAPVILDATLESVHNGVMATGAVSAPWTGACRRCLRDATGTVDARFKELFERRPSEGDTYPLRGEEIDLEPLVREAVLLELPLSPLCAEDCAGLCPECGADRNADRCDCAIDVRDPRWDALDQLRFDH